MKTMWNFIGIILFWLAWPIWSVYFHIVPRRSRVLVVFNDEVLLVKGWLSTGKWMLPGGGAHSHETMEASAIRELEEEVGIISAETALRPMGKHSHHKYGLSYIASYFILEFEDKPNIKKSWPEISEAQWLKFTDIRGHMLDDDAAYALKQYEPIGQTELL
jgi:8-oxo-dGTP pyrophosphatase MutT (NUDIX family)